MRTARIVLFLLATASVSVAQQAPAAVSADKTQLAVESALLGDWTGYLEYRDYSEPATSTKRVQLPTWLKVTRGDTGLSLHYIYDDGPGKIVEEREGLALDVGQGTYTEREDGHPAEVYRGSGFESLRDGRGVLVLTGSGTDNDKPVEERLTLTIRRNLVEWMLEVRPAASKEEFVFRHMYRFTRSEPPAVPAAAE